ncbi:hypothetical protein EMIT079MI2_370001 [Bacillus sp. IT-79MI2]
MTKKLTTKVGCLTGVQPHAHQLKNFITPPKQEFHLTTVNYENSVRSDNFQLINVQEPLF